jgi:C1A family cysteine protease
MKRILFFISCILIIALWTNVSAAAVSEKEVRPLGIELVKNEFISNLNTTSPVPDVPVTDNPNPGDLYQLIGKSDILSKMNYSSSENSVIFEYSGMPQCENCNETDPEFIKYLNIFSLLRKAEIIPSNTSSQLQYSPQDGKKIIYRPEPAQKINQSSCRYPGLAPLSPEFIDYWNNLTIQNSTGQPALNDVKQAVPAGRKRGLIPIPVPFPESQSKSISSESTQSSQNQFPAQYDLRTFNRVSPVRDQGACGACWAFATLGSLESTLLPEDVVDLSENNLKNRHGFDVGPCEGGNPMMAIAYLARWAGPVNELQDPYHDYSDQSPLVLLPREHVQEALYLPTPDDVKSAIMNQGAVLGTIATSDGLMSDSDDIWYNSQYHSYCYRGNENADHAITIVGWNDTYDRKNFYSMPSRDGAWICKNSWGTNWGGAGYFYVSYDDRRITSQNYIFLAENTTNYDYVYQFDPLGSTEYLGYESTAGWFSNIFTIKSFEDLEAVGFYTPDTRNTFLIRVYRDDVLQDSEQGTIPLPGYHTIHLATPVQFTPGQDCTIVVKLTTSGYQYPISIEEPLYARGSSGATANPGESYISSDGTRWDDITVWYPDTNVCLKGYTRIRSVSNYPDLTVTSINGSPDQISGNVLPIKYTVLNKGRVSAAPSDISFLLFDPMSTNLYYLGDDPVPSLVKNTSYNDTFYGVLPNNLPMGYYHCIGVVDPGSVIQEIDEQNNVMLENTLIYLSGNQNKPDLIPIAFSAPSTAILGKNITVKDTIKNQGLAFSGVCSEIFFITTPDPKTPADITLIGLRTIPGLVPNMTSQGIITCSIPAELKEGTYYLGSFVDFADQVPEINEQNNIIIDPIPLRLYGISDAPDVAPVLINVTSSGKPGGSCTMYESLKNMGRSPATSFYNGYGLANYTSGEIYYLGDRLIDYLSNNSTIVLSNTFTIPAGVKPGIYSVVEIADITDVISEPDEDNNIAQIEDGITIRSESPIVIFPGMSKAPGDPDSDGLYEDLNGNERKDFNDVVIYFKYMEWAAVNEPIHCFDYNKNGRIDFNDVVLLFKKI